MKNMLWIAAMCLIARVGWAGEKMEFTPADLKPLVQLVGQWECSADMEHCGTNETFVTTYALTGGGSALVETMTPGTPHEMITVYTRDGDDFLLTHYCSAQNQPRMRAKAPADGRVFDFQFQDATGMKSPNDAHMHALKVEILDATHFRQTWTFFKDGVQQSQAVFNYVRKP